MNLIRKHPHLIFLLCVLGLLGFSSPARALPFGSNKVRYHTDHQWKYFETDHFEIYYYPECEAMAKVAVQYAENNYRLVSSRFGYLPRTKIPLFLYATPSEFQETNITPEILSGGVGGFTEVFKNRIVVPMGGSYHELEKVMTHEMTHAFQYDIIYGEGWRSINLFKAVFEPNWMMEGMAEWMAQHWESQGEMVLRDAVLNDQVMPLSLLDSFDHFEQVYMAYKESQSILEYVSQVYGPGKVVQMFKKMAANLSPDAACRSVLGLPLDQLYDHWHVYMKAQAWSRVKGMPEPQKYGDQVVEEASKAEVSPDGTQVAYLKGEDLVLLNPARKTQTTLTNRHFEGQGSALAWSPDGKTLAFCAQEEGDYYPYLIDVNTRAVKKLKVGKLPVVYSPSWSKDGKYLLFSAFNYTEVDLYRYEVATGTTLPLTHGISTKSWACYGPDGASLYYLDESEGETRILKSQLDPEGRVLGQPVTLGNNLGFVSSFRIAAGKIFLTSDRDNRIFNLYRMNLDGTGLIQGTRTFADVLSVAPSPDALTFYATLYQKGSESIYAFKNEKMENLEKPPVNLAFLSNSFQDAQKVIAPSLPDTQVLVEGEPIPQDREETEVVVAKKEPTAKPLPVSRLEITECSNLVGLQWPGADPEVDGVDSFRVYRSTQSGGIFSPIGTTQDVKHGRYVDYSTEVGNTYYYYVTALNKKGESAPSPTAEAHPQTQVEAKDYHFRISPDILLFVAGYDSSFGFVGGGIVQMSDYLGDHRLQISGDTIPDVMTGFEANYEFSQWRTTVDLDLFYYQNYLRILDLQSGNIVNQFRNNEEGMDLNFSTPLNESTRVEYGLGTQRFQGSPLYLRFSEGLSNYFLDSNQENIANYYRISFVQDKRGGTQFWPSSGYSVNFTLLHALPVLDSNVSFANILLETQVYADIGFLNHLIWANRFIGMTSQGPDPQSFFIGNDEPFQAYFTTIRGYGGKTFFGSNLALFNTELRYPVATHMNFIPQPLSMLMIKDIELAGFLDAGMVSNQISDISSAPLLASIGTGIRFYAFLYQRSLVMFRFDVAWRLDQSLPPTFQFNLIPMF